MGGAPTTWLLGAKVRDLSKQGIGNGPFQTFLGVILHVNVDENGTPITYWGPGNSGQVCPNFQVYKDGSVDQLLPFNWQPWCQVDGNYNYAAIETAGLPSEPLTDAQMASIAKILAIYRDEHGMAMQVANKPGQKGFGIHSMGGQAWGGHSCPGTLRANQRQQILDLASGDDMALTDDDIARIWGYKLTNAHMGEKGTTAAAGVFLTNADRFAQQAAQSVADPTAFAKALVAALPPAAKGGLTEADVEAAVKKVFADAAS